MPDPKPNLEQLQDQLQQAELAGDPWRQGIALNNLGSYFKDLRETGKAIAYFHKALEFFTALDDREKKATVLTNLGGTYLDSRDHAQALEQFALALGTYGSLNHAFGQAMALNNMGGVQLSLRRFEEARKQFILAASFFRSAQTPSWEAQALENLAAAEGGAGDTKAAVESYGRALEIWQKQDQLDRQAMIRTDLPLCTLHPAITGDHWSCIRARSCLPKKPIMCLWRLASAPALAGFILMRAISMLPALSFRQLSSPLRNWEISVGRPMLCCIWVKSILQPERTWLSRRQNCSANPAIVKVRSRPGKFSRVCKSSLQTFLGK